ncbi:sulfite exporter TauE/SafE family protein [Candidatus Woesearchaeota archaeon]|nr:sulfite exporter TauE/SafE family protein [Nanoarchaeota archaeon]MCB9370170.1 sulfite exporter TauE/SafE family protein [Candidatus Woesearchaeota archaeon]USN44700.1 MAG: sulfite exporter TauE/SafE family protein [Candidatus Woesearchaeota archaeon]
MELTFVFIVLAIVAGFVKGFAGFGLSLVLISALLGAGFTASELLPILVPLFVLLDIFLYFENRKYVQLNFEENFTLHSTTLMTLFLGLLLGTFLLTTLDANLLKVAFAVVVLISIFPLVAKVNSHTMILPKERDNGIFGLCTGVLTGLYTLNAIPVTMYLIYHQYPKEKYMGSLVTFLIFSDILLIAVYLYSELFSFEGFVVSFKLLTMVLVGFAGGSLLRRKISSSRFKALIILVLALNALKILFDFFSG